MEKGFTDELSKEVSPSRLELEHADLDMKMQGSNLNEIAREAAVLEHSLGPMAAIKAYPMAIFWSVLVAMCVVMEGMITF